jgi:5'-nucleotidase
MKIKSHNTNQQLVADRRVDIGFDLHELFDHSLSIHSNREINMSKIKLIGFDMDYTLAIYKKSPMESIQYELAKKYLIENMSYPKNLIKTQFDQTLLIRGLIIDKHLGNILKLDDQSYVWRATHCRQPLSTEQIAHLYRAKRIKVGDDRYYSLDTFFSIPEACLFIDTIEHIYTLENNECIDNALHKNKRPNFEKIFDDIRIAMDIIHSNGILKNIIRENIGEFIARDTDIEFTLKKLKKEEKKLFLLTNSSYDYTNTVLNFVFDCRDKKSWLDLFDLVIVDAKKPAFFTENCPFDSTKHRAQSTKILSGGNINDFHRLRNAHGREVLYIGDHIYGDILRSKKDSLWRTCLIIKELNFDIRTALEYKNDFTMLRKIRNEQIHEDKHLTKLRTLLQMLYRHLSDKPDDDQHQRILIEELREQIKNSTATLQKLRRRYFELNQAVDDKFHHRWGRLFSENQELSRFGAQVMQYACIYTDHIKNFLHYGANHVFMARREQMTHEIDLE